MAFTLPDLPYAYDALEPHFDKMTMEIHHKKHHQAYITKLNAAISDDCSDDLLSLLTDNCCSDEQNAAIQNNGGGHYNHSFFWKTLAPGGKGAPCKELDEMIQRDFGGSDEFKKKFKEAAISRFGSGWAWLAMNKESCCLEIFSMPNQDQPKLKTHVPLLGLDVWEHAYYLKYKNVRPDYVEAFFKIVNWDRVNELFYEANRVTNGK